MARVLVTGATGFLGQAVVRRLAAAGLVVRAAVRTPTAQGDTEIERVVIGDISPTTSWDAALDGVDTVVHLAQIAHARADARAIQHVNVDATIALLDAAERAGTGRFVFMSSVKAVGESNDAPWTDATRPNPTSAYGAAKHAVENALAQRPHLNGVSLRPPLVHGPGVRANFALLLRAAASGLWLPFDQLDNARSLISRDAVADAVARVALHRQGAAGAFFIAQDPPLSTTQIVEHMRRALGVPRRLFRAPKALRSLPALAQVFGSLAVDPSGFAAAYPGPAFGASGDAVEATTKAWATAA